MLLLFYTGQPVAWCITNYETTDVLELFFSHVKQRSPESVVSVLMSDDGIANLKCVRCIIIWPISCYTDNAFCSAAKRVYGEGTRHILCRWHIDRYMHGHAIIVFYNGNLLAEHGKII